MHFSGRTLHSVLHQLMKERAFLSCLTLLCLSIFTTSVSAREVIKYHVSERLHDPQKDYFISVLEEACIHSEPEFDTCHLHPVPISMHQGRQLLSLKRELLSIIWTTCTVERESEYLPVRIPLTMGLIGVRVAVVNPKYSKYFVPNADIKSIKSLNLVQGHDWPDLQILQHNQFNVAGINWNSSIFRTLSKGLFDYVFRSILEINTESKQFELSYMIDQNHLFYYPSAVYFFVNKNNVELHERLTFGLSKMVAAGRLKELLLNEPMHKHLREMLFLQKRKIHVLENPLLPTTTPVNDASLWLINKGKLSTDIDN